MKLLFLFCALNLHGLEVVLEWDANSETNIAGYRVYSGKTSRTYEDVADVGAATSFTNDFALGSHFVAVTAYDTSGLESDLSEELALEIVAPPVIRFESNALTWSGTGSWQVRWSTDLGTNQQGAFTNRLSLGMFPAGSMLSVRRCELGATNVLSDFSSSLFFNPPAPPRAFQLRVLLEKSSGANQPFFHFAEDSFFDAEGEQAFYRARLEITRSGLRLR